MIVARLGAVVTTAAVLGVLGGCTSSGSTTPSAPASSRSSSSTSGTGAAPTIVGTAPTAPTASAVTGCVPSHTVLTYHQRLTAIDGEELGVSPGGSVSVPARLPVITVVRAQAPGLQTGSGLIRLLHRHWNTLVASPGQVTRSGATVHGGFTLHDRSKNLNKAYAVFDYVTVYHGSFTARCSGATVHGKYTTFARPGTASFDCSLSPRGAVELVGKHKVCT